MIKKRYIQLFNNLNKIKNNDNNYKKSLENIERLNTQLKTFKNIGKSSSKNVETSFDKININYNVIENEFHSLRENFLKDNFFDENEFSLLQNKLNDLFNITQNLNSIKEVFSQETLICEALSLKLNKPSPVLSDLLTFELNKILKSPNISSVNYELLKFKKNIANKTSLFLDNYNKIINENKIDINSLVLNSKYIANQVNNNTKNLDDYLEHITNNLDYIFKNLHNLLHTYAEYSYSASDKINEQIKICLEKSILDNETILKDIETILITTKEKIDRDEAYVLAEKKAEAEKKRIDEENKKAEQKAKYKAKRDALEKAKKDAEEKALQEQKEYERNSRNSKIFRYIVIVLGVILCCWGIWELSVFLWENYSTEIKWVSAILLAGLIVLLYFMGSGDAPGFRWLSYLIVVTCLSLWFYLGDTNDFATIKSDNVSLSKKNSNKKSNKANSSSLVNKSSQCPNVKYRDNCTDTVFENTGKYVGEFKNNSKHGQGTYIWKDKTEYIGNWKNDKLDGQGKYFYKNGDKYFGQWVNHQKSGQGSYFYKNGNKYVGQWKNDEKNGKGVFTYKSGVQLNGKFYNDVPSYGTVLYGDKLLGDKYKGDFKNWKREGQGTYLYKNGNKYVGQWKNGKKHGSGTLTAGNQIKKGIWKNGEFQNNQRKSLKKIKPTVTKKMLEKAKSQTNTDNNINNKIITKNYNNGKYTGYFKNNKRHGKGSYIFSSGNKYVGQWKNGQQSGKGIFTYKSGTQLNGKFYNGVPSYGTELYADKWSGDKYIGNFKNWEREGQGTYLYKNGDKYVGQWKNGKKHGSGIFTSRNETIKGIWENDKFMYAEGSDNP